MDLYSLVESEDIIFLISSLLVFCSLVNELLDALAWFFSFNKTSILALLSDMKYGIVLA